VVRDAKSEGDLFPGRTAYNDAVTAAFASVLDKKITVPPYNGVMGAIGMALLHANGTKPPARKADSAVYDLHKLELSSRDFVCKACSNLCDMKEFVIEGQKSYWATNAPTSSASLPHRPQAGDRRPVRLPRPTAGGAANAAEGKFRVGLPRAMAMLDHQPFWRRYLPSWHPHGALASHRPAHFRQRHRNGCAQPCYPVQVAHASAGAGHQGVDYILLPNLVDADSGDNPGAAH